MLLRHRTLKRRHITQLGRGKSPSVQLMRIRGRKAWMIQLIAKGQGQPLKERACLVLLEATPTKELGSMESSIFRKGQESEIGIDNGNESRTPSGSDN